MNSYTLIEDVKNRFRSYKLKAAASSGSGIIGAGLPTAVKASIIAPGSIAGSLPAIRPAAAPMSMPPALFLAASSSTQDIANQKQYSQEFSDFIEGICKAICQAHEQWRQMAFFKDAVINAHSVVGGTLNGPDLLLFIYSAAPKSGTLGWADRYSRAVAEGISRKWKDFQGSFKIPGLPWYPSFVMIPSPVAPPTMNVPTPLAACSPMLFMIDPAMIRDAMKQKLGAPGPFSDPLFESIAGGFSQAVRTWLMVQMVTQVMGTGPVPTFAPPFVPAGPVVNGTIIPQPGHLAS